MRVSWERFSGGAKGMRVSESFLGGAKGMRVSENIIGRRFWGAIFGRLVWGAIFGRRFEGGYLGASLVDLHWSILFLTDEGRSEGGEYAVLACSC